MSNAKRWRASLPTSFKSPFHAQADLGYFSLGRKQYGGFFLAVNCFSGHICVFKINNTRMPTLLTAIGKMTKVSDKNYSMLPPPPLHKCTSILLSLQDKYFRDVRTLLFDGEVALNTKKARQFVLSNYKIKLFADPGSKRNRAERHVRGTAVDLFFCR